MVQSGVMASLAATPATATRFRNCGDSKRMCSYPRAVTDHPEVCAPLGVAVESSVGDGVGVAVGLGVGVTSGFWRAARPTPAACRPVGTC